MATEPEEAWADLEAAAREVAADSRLDPDWLSRDCRMWAWALPLGWRARCAEVGVFGGLRVLRLSRVDLIASKVMGAPKRIQDQRDLTAMQPTAEELRAVEANLDRLSAESLDGERFEDERQVVEGLRGAG